MPIGEVISSKQFLCKSRLKDTALLMKSVDNYLEIITVFKEKKCDFQTYQLKQEKPFRVVIRNLHHKEEVKGLSFKVRNIINVFHKSNRSW